MAAARRAEGHPESGRQGGIGATVISYSALLPFTRLALPPHRCRPAPPAQKWLNAVCFKIHAAAVSGAHDERPRACAVPVASEYGARTSDRVAPAPGYVGYAAKLAGGAKGRYGLAFGRLKQSGFRFLALPTRFAARWDAPPWSPSSTLANAGIPPVLAWAGCLRRTSRQADCGQWVWTMSFGGPSKRTLNPNGRSCHQTMQVSIR